MSESFEKQGFDNLEVAKPTSEPLDFSKIETQKTNADFKNSVNSFVDMLSSIKPDEKYRFKDDINSTSTDFDKWIDLKNGVYLRFTEKSGRPVLGIKDGDKNITFQIGDKKIFVREDGKEMPGIGIKNGKINVPENFLSSFDIGKYKKDITDYFSKLSKQFMDYTTNQDLDKKLD